MTSNLVEKIADAVLYEGYILYPYRSSAVKNQQRWNFGALCPQPYSEAQGGTESWTMQTECIVKAGAKTRLNVKIRFLHLLTREVTKRIACQLPVGDCGHKEIFAPSLVGHFSLVPSLEVRGTLFQTWQEAVEREVSVPTTYLARSDTDPFRTSFSFPASETVDLISDDVSGEILGALVRRQEAIAGEIEIKLAEADPAASDVPQITATNHSPLKLTIRILNRTPFESAGQRSRDEALMRSFVSTHTILNVQDGAFVSLLDPPAPLLGFAAACKNVGTYPVLVGEQDTHDWILSSPIILYDYPQIAPESPGSLYDGTEIDEILTLRIMTLTEEEKREMRSTDERARQILERTETLPMEQLMKMHGAMKGVNRES